ncbi:alpha/beta hydrolase [soil metagenome]
MRTFLGFLIVLVILAAAGLAAAVQWGGPADPAAAATAGAKPVGVVELTDLPPVERYLARDGSQLAYRRYLPAAGPARASIALLHGFASRSQSLHAVARALAAAGFEVHVLDLRGHGESGFKGMVDYAGQVSDDVEDFARAVAPMARPRLLFGFDAGGGIALRIAGSARDTLFDAYLPAAPWLGPRASTQRSGNAAGVDTGRARLLAIDLLNRFGVRRYNGLPLMNFAAEPQAGAGRTAQYSYMLAASFRPQPDLKSEIRSIQRPVEIVVGANDEQMVPDRFEAEFDAAGHHVPVTIVPNVGHAGLIVEAPGIQAIVDSANRLAPHRL